MVLSWRVLFAATREYFFYSASFAISMLQIHFSRRKGFLFLFSIMTLRANCNLSGLRWDKVRPCPCSTANWIRLTLSLTQERS